VSEIQAFLSELLSGLAAALPFGLAFGAGMVAAVNPCGFAMLPAYLSLYLGTEESDFAERSATSRALRALAVGCVVLSGFVVLFVLAGAVISAGGTALIRVMPVLGVLVGEALVVLGVWMLLAGRAPYAAVLGGLATRLGDPRKVGVRGFFLFGLAYGVPPSASRCQRSWRSWAAAWPPTAWWRERRGSWATGWGWPRCWCRSP
jgi:cytochrome c-type biogenesis protein